MCSLINHHISQYIQWVKGVTPLSPHSNSVPKGPLPPQLEDQILKI